MELKYDSEAIVQLNSLEPEYSTTEFLMFLLPPKNHAKRLATLLYPASETELLALFQYIISSTPRYRFQFNMEALVKATDP